MNWLAKLAEADKTDEQLLAEAVDSLSPSQLSTLAVDLGLEDRPTQVEDMQQKIAAAHKMGIELAHEQTKEAMLPALASGIARMAVGGAAKAGLGSAAKGALNATAGSPTVTGTGGGFKYAGVMGQMAQKATGFLVRNPGAALTAGGAAAGALLAPRDPYTGEKQFMRGALMGGGIAAGANALSKGQIANKMRAGVMNPKSPALGQGARSYIMDAAKATKPVRPGAVSEAPAAMAELKKMPPPTPNMSAPQAMQANLTPDWQAAHAGVQEMQEKAQLQAQLSQMQQAKGWKPGPSLQPGGFHNSGPIGGEVKVASLKLFIEKLANRQTLTYDPASKTFMRHHVTDDASMGQGRGDVIPAGHSEPVARGQQMSAHRGQMAAPGTPAGGGMSAVHSLHGGDVISSSPRPGVAARPMGTPPPVPAAARMGGPAGLAGAAAKPKLPSLGGAMSLAGGLKKIGGAMDVAKKVGRGVRDFGTGVGLGAYSIPRNAYRLARDADAMSAGAAAGMIGVPAGAYALGRASKKDK